MAERNPFVILGVSENCTQNELFEAYNAQKQKYSELRFEAGEVGADACNRLDEIEDAYEKASEILRSRFEVTYTGDNLSDVDTAIKENRLDDAQRILDECAERSARWHYLQSAVFYRKGWYQDAMQQMEFACQMDPDNTEYAESRKTMKEKIHTDSARHSFYEERKGERSYSGMDGEPTGRGCGVCDCCSTLLCADCCCECMGGDLITCC